MKFEALSGQKEFGFQSVHEFDSFHLLKTIGLNIRIWIIAFRN